MPINYLKEPLPRGDVLPADVTRDRVRTDYEDVFAQRAVKSDDWMPYVAPWRAVPWLEAMCGCPVRSSAGSLAAGRFVETADRLRSIAMPGNSPWFERLREQTRELQETAPEDCCVSPTILRGTSDVLAAMRGLGDFFLDLSDDPQAVADAAARVNELHLDVLDIPRIAGLQMTVEANGPQLSDLISVLREILERTRLILFVDSHFDQLQATTSDGDFKELLAANW